MEVLRIDSVYLRRGSFVLSDVNLCISEGQMLAVVGRSGSGKSTLISGIGGALRPEAGKISYWGRQMYENEAQIRRKMSVVYDAANFNLEMNPQRLVREIAKFEPDFDREAFAIYMEQLELDKKMRARLYSPERQKKLMLILALCRMPELLIMDEPTGSVDPESGKLMWEIVENYRREHTLTVLYTTHHEEETRRADDVLRIDKERK